MDLTHIPEFLKRDHKHAPTPMQQQLLDILQAGQGREFQTDELEELSGLSREYISNLLCSLEYWSRVASRGVAHSQFTAWRYLYPRTTPTALITQLWRK